MSCLDVSWAAKLLDEELGTWRNRSIGEIVYLILDACYDKVRHVGNVVDSAVLLAAVGVRADCKRSVLGASVSMSEAEVHCREFVESLQNRGMYGVRMVTSDDHKGLKSALQARLTGVQWQPCQFHL